MDITNISVPQREELDFGYYVQTGLMYKIPIENFLLTYVPLCRHSYRSIKQWGSSAIPLL